MDHVKGTVLVAEDDATVRHLLCLALTSAGYLTLEATRGDEVVDMLAHVAVDAVLLDLQLPGQDGHAVLRALKSDPTLRSVPVIMVTADMSPQSLVSALRAGAQDFVRKPFDVVELLARVEVAIDRAARMRSLARAAEQMEHLALTDGLTGLDNRRAAERHLERMTAHGRRTGEALAVLVIDIDRFKPLNDTHGHAAGDAVLVEVAARLEAEARTGDVVARWGGEEFVVLLPGTDAEQASAAAERLRAAVSQTPIPLADAPAGVFVTVSIGVAAGGNDALDSLMWAADAALYDAKRAGRDRVAAAAVRAADKGRTGLSGCTRGGAPALSFDQVV